MPQELKIKTNLPKYLLPGEIIIYRGKAHKGIWLIPLLIIIGCVLFILSYPQADIDILIGVGFLTFFIFFFFLIYLIIYIRTEILLTNKRLIIRKIFETTSLNIEDARILQYEDAATRLQNMNKGERKSKSLLMVFAFILDIVEITVIDKNAAVYCKIDLISLLNYKQLNKFFLKEREKCEENNF